MNAQELTKEYEKLATAFHELKKTVTYLEDETSKLRLLVNDMWYDLKDTIRQAKYNEERDRWKGCQGGGVKA